MKDIYEKVKRIERQFNARVRPKNVECWTPYKVSHNYNEMEDFSITRDITPGVEITMSEESFSAMMDEFTDVTTEEYKYFQYMLKVEGQGWLNRMLNIRDRALREGRLRDQNPTLRAAWEQYQILLKLLDN